MIFQEDQSDQRSGAAAGQLSSLFTRRSDTTRSRLIFWREWRPRDRLWKSKIRDSKNKTPAFWIGFSTFSKGENKSRLPEGRIRGSRLSFLSLPLTRIRGVDSPEHHPWFVLYILLIQLICDGEQKCRQTSNRGWRYIRSSNGVQYFVHWAHSPNLIEPYHQQSVNPVCPNRKAFLISPYPSKRVLINLSNLFDI